MYEEFKMAEFDDELYHHGIPGQKWYIRRFQNPDGSLTPLGRQRYGTKSNFEKAKAAKKAYYKSKSKKTRDRKKAEERTQKEIAKYKSKMEGGSGKQKKASSKTEKPKQEKQTSKKLSEMSDAELQAFINRQNLERQYYQYMAEQKKQQMSVGERFVKSLGKDVIAPAAKESVKNLAKSAFQKAGQYYISEIEKSLAER